MAIATAQRSESPAPGRQKDRVWAPHMWDGCNFGAWMRLLLHNRFRVGWRHLWIPPIITAASVAHTALRWVQNVVYGRRIRRTQLKGPPIFVLGHWRTGTSFLHELLALDPRHTFPTYYECFEPNHFLLTEKFFTNYVWFLAPNKRPMDNMRVSWDLPQEDEFAMCMLGQPSPYLAMAFPNNGPAFPEYLDLEGLSPRALERWKSAFMRFLQTITYRKPRRLVLKSPPHTCRIKVLEQMFPGALYVHIVRNPYVVFPSTVKLWKSMSQRHGLQKPHFRGLEEYVFETFTRMYAKLDETRPLVPPERFFELRYEDLVRNPVGQMQDLYDHLQLGEFDAVLPKLENYLDTVAGYETNRFELDPAQRAEIKRRWGTVIKRYGYE
jgi:hypothetical protein